jgi:hypothetical protein
MNVHTKADEIEKRIAERDGKPASLTGETAQEEQKRPIGRPSKYDPDTHPDQARKLCEMGATNAQLADFFEVDVATIERWALQHEAFCGAVKIGKDANDNRVERTLYEKAIAGDTTAMIFWLKNRRRLEWRDRQDHTVTGEVTHLVEHDVRKTAKAIMDIFEEAAQIEHQPAIDHQGD